LFLAAERTRASSIHALFLTETERGELIRDGRLRPRLSQQFHFHNRGYADFEHYLSTFRSAMRKQVRRERKSVLRSGLTIETRTGSDITDTDWSALHRYYVDTCQKHGSPTY